MYLCYQMARCIWGKTSSDRSLKQPAVFSLPSIILIPPFTHAFFMILYTALVFSQSLAHSSAILVLHVWKCCCRPLKSASFFLSRNLSTLWFVAHAQCTQSIISHLLMVIIAVVLKAFCAAFYSTTTYTYLLSCIAMLFKPAVPNLFCDMTKNI